MHLEGKNEHHIEHVQTLEHNSKRGQDGLTSRA
jgi:hypothetical protein